MKLLFATIFLTLVFSGLASAQSIKTDEARKLKQVEALIIKTETALKEADESLKKLQVSYSEEYPKIKQIKLEIAALDEALVKLYAERKELQSKQMVRNLPNNQIELLKILIQQNERIIDLLETSQKQSPF